MDFVAILCVVGLLFCAYVLIVNYTNRNKY